MGVRSPSDTRAIWLERWLGPTIDAAAIDGRKTLWQRLAVGVVAALVIAANLGIAVGATWLGVAYVAEGLSWMASREQRQGRTGTVEERLYYLLATALSTVSWSVVALLYWFSGRPGLQIVAIVIASAQLIHAQAFTFRSRAVLIISGGIPAAMLIGIVLVSSGLVGLELLTAALGVATTLAYVVASACANRRAAQALDQSRDELEKIAYSDALTTLSNRRRFTEDMRQLMEYSRRHGTRFALVLIDIDRFKTVNDRLGHDAGDAVLRAAAERLRAVTGGDDRVARLGGDEFAVLLADATDSGRVEAFCRTVLDSFAATLDFNGAKLAATSSIGVAIYPADGVQEEALYKAADVALYAAKHGGRNTWRAFDPGLAVAV